MRATPDHHRRDRRTDIQTWVIAILAKRLVFAFYGKPNYTAKLCPTKNLFVCRLYCTERHRQHGVDNEVCQRVVDRSVSSWCLHGAGPLLVRLQGGVRQHSDELLARARTHPSAYQLYRQRRTVVPATSRNSVGWDWRVVYHNNIPVNPTGLEMAQIFDVM